MIPSFSSFSVTMNLTGHVLICSSVTRSEFYLFSCSTNVCQKNLCSQNAKWRISARPRYLTFQHCWALHRANMLSLSLVLNPSLSTQVPRVLIEAFWFSHDTVLAGNSADVLPAPVNVTFFLFFLTPFSNVEVVKNLFHRDRYMFNHSCLFFLKNVFHTYFCISMSMR